MIHKTLIIVLVSSLYLFFSLRESKNKKNENAFEQLRNHINGVNDARLAEY